MVTSLYAMLLPEQTMVVTPDEDRMPTSSSDMKVNCLTQFTISRPPCTSLMIQCWGNPRSSAGTGASAAGSEREKVATLNACVSTGSLSQSETACETASASHHALIWTIAFVS